MTELSEDEKKPEVPLLEPLSKLYNVSKPIDAKFFNTPNRMAEVGWLPQWKLREAVRELLANMIDQARTVAKNFLPDAGELEFTEESGRFVVHIGTNLLAEAKWGKKKQKYVKSYHNAGIIKARAEVDDSVMEETQFLELISYSSAMPYTSFYVGHSTKRNNLAVIGKHGEGLTGACVVLNRAGCNIIAECTHNAYQAHIVRLRNDVCFQLKRKKDSSSARQDTVRFTVVFDPRKPAEDMQELMNSVRLPATAAAAGITTARGTLLLDPTLRGKQFNRSIFVGEDANCLFGYDFLDPDKNLLEGRDRNAHSKNNLITECGAIISEAIVQNEEVRKELLKCFLYGQFYNPESPGEMALKRYDDLKDGEGLTIAAIEALRLQYEQGLPAAGQKVVYCTRDTTMLHEIKRVNNMVSVYCHRVLHNHATIVADFQTALRRDAVALDPTTRVGALRDQLVALLGVRELQQSMMDLPDAQAGVWVINNVGYVTCVYSLGAAHAVGLTEVQETSVTRSLRFAQVPVENEVKIMRLLRNQPEPAPPVVEEIKAEVVVKEEATEETVVEAVEQAIHDQQDNGSLPEATALVAEPIAPALTATATAFPEDKVAESLAACEPEYHEVMAPPLRDSQLVVPHEEVIRAAQEHLDDIGVIEGENDGDDNPFIGVAEDCDVVTLAYDCDLASDGGEEAGEFAGDAEHGAEDSDAFDLGSEYSHKSDSSYVPDELDDDRRGGELPSPKRQRLDRLGSSRSGTSSADTTVEVIDLSSDILSVVSTAPRPPPQLLQELPQEIALSDKYHSTVRQLRFFKPCGVWLFSDNADSEQEMEELLNACLPTYNDRYKMRILKSLLHIVVFVSTDKRAPPAFNFGSQCMCINLRACGSEQMFKFVLHAQMQAVNLVE